jgi:hypothetical protein
MEDKIQSHWREAEINPHLLRQVEEEEAFGKNHFDDASESERLQQVS